MLQKVAQVTAIGRNGKGVQYSRKLPHQWCPSWAQVEHHFYGSHQSKRGLTPVPEGGGEMRHSRQGTRPSYNRGRVTDGKSSPPRDPNLPQSNRTSIRSSRVIAPVDDVPTIWPGIIAGTMTG
ncbi:Hypothetical predicted protein [Pelobates cultripes]|uniref:Uncharacterized protein n=1 Tax=Pelobates cultripes TaxID=61616 RepID=A0AAD1WFE6_PELCU|nr:Hypothetical predicted protein [Pelobates cultripes]